MGVFATVVAVISIASLLYIAISQPEYLRKTREGVPYFTPPVVHPETEEALELDTLIRHYRGDE